MNATKSWVDVNQLVIQLKEQEGTSTQSRLATVQVLEGSIQPLLRTKDCFDR
jgi:hypothetical protein